MIIQIICRLLLLLHVLFAIPVDSILTEEQEKSVDAFVRSSDEFKNLPPLTGKPTDAERTLKPGQIPSYVVEYAPVVHLYSEEKYLPYDITEFVKNFRAEYGNGTKIDVGKKHLEITDLEKLPPNEWNGTVENKVYMMSLSDFDKDPEWITGKYNLPNYYNGEIKNAPAALIVVDKGNGWIDAYWFYFYSFNLGPFVMGFGPFGDHVGDWEHSLVRFYKGEPVIVWMSAHGGGGAYFYSNMEKHHKSKHPVIFSARGTHANYPSTGQHAHDLPYSILSDFTDRGALWNPTLNYLAYTYDNKVISFANGSHPFRELQYGNWLKYRGTWGDKKLLPNDPRQHWSPFEWKYIDGPSGPITKNLLRTSPCQRAKWWNFWNGCNVRNYIQYGQGVFDQEGNNNCGHFYSYVKNRYLRKIIETLTWGGWFCFIMDLVNG